MQAAAGPHRWLWPTFEQAFLDDLALVHQQLGPLHAVLFTGDLTQMGSTAEFERLSEWLGQLWAVLRSLGSDPVLLTVPGNHDLRRPAAEHPPVRVLARWRQEPAVQEEFWTKPSCAYRQLIDQSFGSYMDWLKTLGPKLGIPLPTELRHGLLAGDQAASLQTPVGTIGVLGLNSAFLQLGAGDYRGRLTLSAAQLSELCEGSGYRWARRHELCLLLTHHPADWLDAEGRLALNTDINPPGRFAVHLYGHMHEAATREQAEGGAPPRRSWQAPSLFGLERYAGADGQPAFHRSHGYTVGQISRRGDRYLLRQFPRVAMRQQAAYYRLVPDMSYLLERDEGTVAIELSPLRPPAPRSSQDAPLYSMADPLDTPATQDSATFADVRLVMINAIRQFLLIYEDIEMICIDWFPDTARHLPQRGGSVASALNTLISKARPERILIAMLRYESYRDKLREALPDSLYERLIKLS
jgi:hypothetical protein